MQTLNRRKFLSLTAAATGAAALPLRSGAATARVVVLGGGFGGASVARYLRMWNPGVAVTLVEPNPTHVSCILSNLVVTGLLSMSRINLSYAALRNKKPGDRVPMTVLRDNTATNLTITLDARPAGHSVKPDEAYRMIERLSPEPRVELFGRAPRAGWTVLGADL